MATKVLMEALSPTMEEGRLVEWKKQEGELVTVGEILAEVETDKAVMDLQARAAGSLLKQVIAPGTTVPVGALVGVIGSQGEDIAGLLGGSAPAPAGMAVQAGGSAARPAPSATREPAEPALASPVSTPPSPRSAPAPAPAPPSGRATPSPRSGQAEPPGTRIKASPLAKRVAAETGVDLSRIRGSGPEGRIIVRDLEAPPAATPAVASARPPVPPSAGFTDVPLTQLRKTIAKRLTQSIGPIPTYYLTTEVEMDRVAEARDALNESARRPGGTAERDEPPKVSFNDIVLKAAAQALREHAACNAWWQDDYIRYWHDVHLSVAVAIEDGLITPVIRHADRKTLREIGAEVRDLAARARERRLQPDEYTGGTFSVSNLGMFDIDQFTAVINPPEAAILAVGSIVEKPVVENGQLVPRKRMRLTLSCDHRVIDGATGAKFLQTLKRMLENPLALVW
jgi:pyruvate dehydrogenase E2 component (dihydrolipoamide acetyltransferase)